MTVRDLLLYCAIGIAVAASAILYGIHQAKTNQPPGLPIKWLGFAIMTGLILLNAVRPYRSFWKQHRYWALLSVFVIVHFGIGFVIVSRLEKASLTNFAFFTLIEYFAMTAYFDHFLKPKS